MLPAPSPACLGLPAASLQASFSMWVSYLDAFCGRGAGGGARMRQADTAQTGVHRFAVLFRQLYWFVHPGWMFG